MSRLINVQPCLEEISAEVVVAVGDVLRFSAAGAHTRTGAAVELLGIFTDSVLGPDGHVLSPMGPPGTVLFRACTPGRAVIDLVTGDPWQSPTAQSITIRVEG